MSADTTAAELRQELDRGRRGIVAPYVSGFTPWGPADAVGEYAPGLVWVTTPSHGGIWVSAERLRAFPDALRNAEGIGVGLEGAGGSAWFEEDAAAALVVLAFPEVFTAPNHYTGALRTARYFWPEAIARWEAEQSHRASVR